MSNHINILQSLRRVSIALSLAALPSMGGCLVTSDTTEKRSGNYVAENTFDQIEPGKTTASWVRATIGQPSSVSRLDDGTEIWKYAYTQRKESSGGVFLLFGGHSADETDHTAFVQIKNGVVTKAWRG